MRKYDDPQPGMQFGTWTVIEKVVDPNNQSRRLYRCRCQCGKEKLIQGSLLWAGSTRSCRACDYKARALDIRFRRLRGVWKNMHDRCTNSKARHWTSYGGRGIRVCEQWLSLNVFIEWATSNGYSDDLQIDRIDNDGHYEPSNCRFVTCRENCSNTSRNVRVEAFGETKTLKEWASDSRCVVGYQTLWSRIKDSGWSFNDAMLTPIKMQRSI